MRRSRRSCGAKCYRPVDPSKRFVTLVLAAGVVVLLVAIAVGERMGDRVLGQSSHALQSVGTVTITPDPNQVSGPFGPDWKRSQTLSAAPDPRFPDPRIPPKPLPTPIPVQATAAPRHTKWTPNPNIPIWDQTPPPSASASPNASPSETPSAGSASPSGSPRATASPSSVAPSDGGGNDRPARSSRP